MSQQIHHPQQQQSSESTRRQAQSGMQQMHQEQTRRFEDTLNGAMRVALHDFVQATTVSNWCADECLGSPEMEECARLCRDVADLAALNVALLSRDSLYGADVAETFAHAAEECEAVCSQFPHDHCQETASVLRRAIDSTWAMLDSLQPTTAGGRQSPTAPTGPVLIGQSPLSSSALQFSRRLADTPNPRSAVGVA